MKTSCLACRFALAATASLSLFAASAGPKSSLDYVHDGLVAMWDGYENSGRFDHRADVTKWVDLVGGVEIELPDWVSVEDHSLYSAGPSGTATHTATKISSIEGLSSSDAAWTIEVVQQSCGWTKTDNYNNLQNAFNTPRGTVGYRQNNARGFYFYGPSSATQCSLQNWVHATAQIADLHTMSAVLGADKATCSIWMDGVKDTVNYNANHSADRGTVFSFFGNARMNIRVFAIRVYNRKLTQEEVASNRAVDVTRFVNGEFLQGGLVVSGAPAGVGSTSPAYGSVVPADGETVVCRADAAWTNAEGTVRADCRGWKLYDATSGELMRSSADDGEQLLVCSHTHEPGAAVQLVWQWEPEYKVSVVADGGTVSGGGWHAEGEKVTVSVAPGDGQAFGRWTGDVASASRFDNPLSFAMGGAPVELTASFRKVVYVSKTGDDENGGTSWDDALATIPAALKKDPAPHVLVGEGRFDVSTAIKVTNAVTICGSGVRGTVVRLNAQPSAGDATRAVFYVKNPDALLKNLALTTGGTARGRGLYLSGGVVEDCSITNCVTVNGDMHGGGVYLVSGTLRDSLVYYNQATSSGGYKKEGGGIYMTGGTVDRCIIRNNHVTDNRSATANASGKGGGIRMTSGTVRNCLIYDNYARSDGNAIEISGGTVENCTIVRNGRTSLGYNAVNATGSPTLRNTIVRGNISTTGSEANLSLASTVKLENVMSLGSSRSEIITSDPAFVDADGKDWHILYGAAVDAGVDKAWMTDGLDLDGAARISGQHVDIGCYEYVSGGLACGFDVTTDGSLGESTVTLTGSVVGAAEADVTFTWTLIDSLGNETEKVVVGSGTLQLPMSVGTYAVRLSVSDGVNAAEAPERANAFTVYAEHLYVSPEGSGTFPYGDFATAATNVEDAIALATDGTTVHLADGVYRLKDRLAINDGIVIEHAGDPMGAVVTGGREGTCLILLNHADAKLSGLDICGSYPRWVPGASEPAKSICSGVRIMAGGTVTNCVVEGCCCKSNVTRDKGQGGGIDMAAGLVVDCIIRNNREMSSGGGGVQGGGIFLEGGMVDRCVITNNWASPGSDCRGGGVYAKDGTLRNSLVAYCQSSGHGGGVFQNGGAVKNCTIVRNSATSSGGGVSGVVTDCLVYGNKVNGLAVDTDDPGFVDVAADDFRLDAASAAIDASVASGVGALDLERHDRYSGGVADKGCFEFDQSVVSLGVGYERLSEFYPGEVAFTASAGFRTADLDAEKCWWTFDGTEPSADNHAAVGIAVTNTLAPGRYTVRFKTALDGEPYEVVKTDWFVLNGDTIYVNPKCATPVEPYATWDTASRDINAAFEYMVAGSTVVVSDGTYAVTSEQVLSRKVTVRSLNGPAVTKFTTRPFTVSHAEATVAGFTFDGVDTWQNGGGLLMSAGTVSNCVFRNCKVAAGGGGGVRMTGGRLVDSEIASCYLYRTDIDQYGSGINASGSGCLIDRCYVHGCYYNKGTARACSTVFLGAGARMRNSVIAGNTIEASGNVLLGGTSALENCTVVDNATVSAGAAGGVTVGSDGLATVVNTIIWNNTNTTDNVLRETGGPAERFDTCCTEEPVFRRRGDKWRLSSESPCMNAGKPLEWQNGATDFYGNPRVRYGRPDIGAVESPYSPGVMLFVR